MLCILILDVNLTHRFNLKMEIFDKIRKYENLHIIFWLIKDTCWMLGLKVLGALMIFPTLGVAIYIIYKTRF